MKHRLALAARVVLIALAATIVLVALSAWFHARG